MNSVQAILILENNNGLSGVTGAVPAVLVDVLGKSTLQRTVDALTSAGLAEVIVVAEPTLANSTSLSSLKGARLVRSEAAGLWRTAERLFPACADTATHIFLIRLNAYLELNWNAIFQHHQRHANRLTRIYHQSEPLDICLASASRRNDAAYLLRSGLRQSRTDCTPYHIGSVENGDEYVNLLEHEHDLRRLASDALHGDCKLQPEGRQIRPGIWAGADSRIDRSARLVAPVFIGRRARVRAGAVVTRGSAVEHHSIVGPASIVENATVLPYTKLGAGLDVCHSLVGNQQIFHLQRNFCTSIQDTKLLDQISESAGLRTLAGAASLLAFLPRQVWQGLSTTGPEPVDSPNSYINTDAFKPVTAEKEPAEISKLSAGLAVVRRYGNQ